MGPVRAFAMRERCSPFHALALPAELLQRVLGQLPLDQRLPARLACKAFASAVAEGVGGVHLRQRHGNLRDQALKALAAFPRARRVALSVDGGAGGSVNAKGHRGSCGDILSSASTATTTATTACFPPVAPIARKRFCSDNGASASAASQADDLGAVLDLLAARGGVKSLAMRFFGRTRGVPPLPLPRHIAALAERGLEELDFSDASCARAAEQGACNVLLHADGVKATSAALVELARAAPRLRRLGLACAVFMPASVAELGALGHLESLSISGAIECGSPAEATATYARLLERLPRLTTLRLPMAVPRSSACLDDSDDEDDGGGAWQSMAFGRSAFASSGASARGAATKADHAATATAAAAPWAPTAAAQGAAPSTAPAPALVLPPLLDDLTISLCAFNRAVFEAACSDEGGVCQRLRALRVTADGGFSHWDGTFLSGVRDFQLLARLARLETLHLELELGHLRLTADNRAEAVRQCFQQLTCLKGLMDLRVSVAQQPVSFSVRKRSSSHMASAFALPPPMPGAVFDQLLECWPRMQRLTFFKQCAVRRNGRLIAPSWEELVMAPAAASASAAAASASCCCCSSSSSPVACSGTSTRLACAGREHSSVAV